MLPLQVFTNIFSIIILIRSFLLKKYAPTIISSISANSTRLAHNLINYSPPLICRNPGGAYITSPRIKLRDGRYLAYKEYGIPKEKPGIKIVVVHGHASSKEETFPASPELVEELGICFVPFDRAGYGESDLNPKRTVKSESMDIDELAFQLNLGPKFYLIGISMGGYAAYSCLQYIPHRLSSVVLLVPAVNYWWPSLPVDLSKSAFEKLDFLYQTSFWVAHNLPFLFCGWMKQNLFGSSPIVTERRVQDTTSKPDLEIIELQKISVLGTDAVNNTSTRQGVYESLCRDVTVVFSNWEFDPMKWKFHFQIMKAQYIYGPMQKIQCVRLRYRGMLQRSYHGSGIMRFLMVGHTFFKNDGWGDKIVEELLLDEESK